MGSGRLDHDFMHHAWNVIPFITKFQANDIMPYTIKHGIAFLTRNMYNTQYTCILNAKLLVILALYIAEIIII